MTKNSNTLSREAESDMPDCTMGETSLGSLPDDVAFSLLSNNTLSRACIHPLLPRMVLISPLWANKRKGWASDQVGKVLVLNREWTSAKPLVK